MDETREIIKEQFKKLPKDVQEAILSSNVPEKLDGITKKNRLHIDQAGKLEMEVFLTILTK